MPRPTITTSVPAPIADPQIIDRITAASELNIVDVIRQYDLAKRAKDDAEETMKGLKEKLTLGLAYIRDHVVLDEEKCAVEIHYPGVDGGLERWSLALQTNHYEKLSAAKLLACGVTTTQLQEGTEHSSSSFTIVKRLK